MTSSTIIISLIGAAVGCCVSYLGPRLFPKYK